LEERIADLEATTARKGNRKMSLTITGQVHRMILFWDDGHSSDTYYGIDNTNSSSRFSFTGTAKVTPTVSMGFDITIEIEAGGTSSKLSQFDEDGKLGAQINGGFGASFNAANVDAYFGDARRAAWWVEDTRLGRLTVGRYESAGAITTIDLAGIGAGASASVILVNGGFLVRGSGGQYFGINWGNLGDPAANQGRTEEIRWDSPTWQGFILSASIGEAGDYWGVMLRYANEFNGVRVAAGIGYERATDIPTAVGCVSIPTIPNANLTAGSSNTCVNPPGAGPANLVDAGSVSAWGAGLSALHVPSGLFIQGHYLAADFDNPNPATNPVTGYWAQVANKKDANQWLVQAGITKNWWGFGNTALFVEYSKNNDWGAGTGAGRNYNTAITIPGTVNVAGVVDTDMTVWGAGITQNLDAAATELYLDWRHFSTDINCSANCGVGFGRSLPTDAFDAVIAGARVKF
jgi:hypothetical protein